MQAFGGDATVEFQRLFTTFLILFRRVKRKMLVPFHAYATYIILMSI
jgi:hypothetical protein